jgi:hypothetical protein
MIDLVLSDHPSMIEVNQYNIHVIHIAIITGLQNIKGAPRQLTLTVPSTTTYYVKTVQEQQSMHATDDAIMRTNRTAGKRAPANAPR